MTNALTVVRVRVVVYEDDVPVDSHEIGYYEGQRYSVEVVTPDGTDVRLSQKAGQK